MNICILIHFTDWGEWVRINNFTRITQLMTGVQIQPCLKSSLFPSSYHLSCSRRSKIWMGTGAQETAGTNKAHLIAIPLCLLKCVCDFKSPKQNPNQNLTIKLELTLYLAKWWRELKLFYWSACKGPGKISRHHPFKCYEHLDNFFHSVKTYWPQIWDRYHVTLWRHRNEIRHNPRLKELQSLVGEAGP